MAMDNAEHYTSLHEFTEEHTPRGKTPILYTSTEGRQRYQHIWISCTLIFTSALESCMTAERRNSLSEQVCVLWFQRKRSSALNAIIKIFMVVRANQAILCRSSPGCLYPCLVFTARIIAQLWHPV